MTTIAQFYQQAAVNPSAYIHVTQLTREEFDQYIHETHTVIEGLLEGFYQGELLIGVYSTTDSAGYYAVK
jgi:hypothetical protein